MARQWYYQVKGMEAGPVSSAELRTMARQGLLSADAQVRNGPTARWVSAAKIQGLFELMPAARDSSGWPPAAPQQELPEAVAPIPPIASMTPEPEYVGEEIVEEIAKAKKVCPECAAVLSDKAALCVDCGFDLRTGKKIVAEVTSEDEQKTSARVGHVWMAVGGGTIGAVLLGLLIMLFGSRGDPASMDALDVAPDAASTAAAPIGGESHEATQQPIVFVDLPPIAPVESIPPQAAAVESAPVKTPTAPTADDPQLSAAWQRDWAAFGEALKQTHNQQQFLGKEVQWAGTFDNILDKPGGKKIIQLKMPRIDVRLASAESYRFAFDNVQLVLVDGELGEWTGVPTGQAVTFRTTINERNADSAESDVNGIRVIKVTFIGRGARLFTAK